MGFEDRPKHIRERIIKASMNVDSTELRRMQAASVKSRQTNAAERRKKKMLLAPAERREISDELYQEKLREAALTDEKAVEVEETPDLLPDPAQARRDDLLPEDN